MKSPFPGMDPYLERHWGDVHTRLVMYACDQLQAALPESLLARVEERIYVENEVAPTRPIIPDVRVIEHGQPAAGAVAILDDVQVAEPFVLHMDNEPVTETFIEIREVGSGHRVITVIEFLSPANKIPGDGQRLYLKKMNELQAAGINLVEIDLILAGHSGFSLAPRSIPAHLRTPYYALVHLGRDWSKTLIYPMQLKERLSAFHIPLRKADREIVLNLQALIEQSYRNGRYDTIDYQAAADPPLEGHDAEWAAALLRAAGKRP
jgi:hypothetical protein